MYRSIVKPLFDFVTALVCLVLFSPILILLILILLFLNKGNIFFIQKRIGKNEKSFFIYKFRTMKDLKDANGNYLPDDMRQQSFGTFLRRLHLDELPQLFNVLKGDLSLIGPRPLLPEYLRYYSASQNKRHDVRPGITGLSQVLGGNSLEWHQRLRMDSFYAEKISFMLDIRVMLMTLTYIFKKHKKGKAFSKSFIDSLPHPNPPQRVGN